MGDVASHLCMHYIAYNMMLHSIDFLDPSPLHSSLTSLTLSHLSPPPTPPFTSSSHPLLPPVFIHLLIGLLVTTLGSLHQDLQTERTIAVAATTELSRQYAIRTEQLEHQMTALMASLSQQTQRTIAAEQREKVLASELV